MMYITLSNNLGSYLIIIIIASSIFVFCRFVARRRPINSATLTFLVTFIVRMLIFGAEMDTFIAPITPDSAPIVFSIAYSSLAYTAIAFIIGESVIYMAKALSRHRPN